MNEAKPIWTEKRVRAALVDAFRTLERTTSRPGHKRLKAAWPEYQIEQADYVEQVIAKNFKGRKVRIGATSEQISQMERVLLGWRDQEGRDHPAWLAGRLLAYPEHRAVLVAWVAADLEGKPSVQLCRERGWPLASYKRKRAFAAQIIADRANETGLSVW